MLFRKYSEEQEARLLVVVGVAVVTVIGAVAALVIMKPFASRPADLINVVVESPYVGEGVQPGTPLMVHGVNVGEVRQVTSLRNGGIRLVTALQAGPTAGLTDTMGLDFRPANYFGVTGINVRPGQGGRPLTNGSLIHVTPTGNFTLQAMLQRLGEISHGVFTPKLVDVIERSTTYLDGLDPLLETMLVVAETTARVQTVSTEQLMGNATGISVAFPGFVNASISTGDYFLHGALDGATEDFFQNTFKPTIKLASTDLFGAAGRLVGSHSTDLAPLTNMLKILTDVAPGVIPPDAIADTAREYRERLQLLFGGPPDRRAVNVRIILDSLPGVAAPLDAVGAVPPPDTEPSSTGGTP
ncbi:Mammalian cell entry related domain protein [Mycobacterium sp. AT1]|uniref:Mammalian cell entry related domain protein n=1 Tax=Mycobacterium sp. AT1 TaxID=1961706 RepID=UPI0009ABED84|nr:Mammalian cell entry related domain protein [Mycobacterium sp. AT1]OPX12051.1 Mammalian cell entry related domain protein [Mycobacterium sp. AT1]